MKKNVVIGATVPITLEKFFPEYVRQLQAGDFKVWLVCSNEEAGANALRLAYPEAGMLLIPMVRGVSLFADLLGLFRWIVALAKVRPVRLITMTPKASLLGHLAAWITRVPIRQYVTGGLRLEGSFGAARGVLWICEKLTCVVATEVVANSRSLANVYEASKLARAPKLRCTIPGSSHGVDSVYFSPRRAVTGDQKSIIGFVGRLTQDKGITTLLDACDLLSQQIPFILRVVGPANERDSTGLLHRFERSTYEIDYVGEVQDVRPHVGGMDLLVLPSRREGFPNAVLEAAAMAVPSVVADSTGTRDSVRNGETGIIVPVDNASALAEAIRGLLVSESQRLAFGEEARRWVVDSFQPQAVVKDVLAIGK